MKKALVQLVAPVLLLSNLLACCGQREGDVRLVGGSYYRGTIEVFHNNTWGTICDDRWHRGDGDVVCRQLGFELGSQRILYRAYYGQGHGPIWIDEIDCPRDGKSLLDCSPKPSEWGKHDCMKREDAGVDCRRQFPRKPVSMPLRVSCPECTQYGNCSACRPKRTPSRTDCTPQVAVEGILFAQYNNEWLPVSGEGWNLNAAKVACGELGYPIALPPPPLSQLWTNYDGNFLRSERCGYLYSGKVYPECSIAEDLGSGDGRVEGCRLEVDENKEFRDLLKRHLLSRVFCEGNENALMNCYFSSFGPFDTQEMNVATVRCAYNPHQDCQSADHKHEKYRLRGSAAPGAGRLEVKKDGYWGTVCHRSWTIEDAHVACRALGFGLAKTFHYHAFYGRGVGTIHYSDLRCKGSESSLSECESRPGYGCNHGEDASLECTVPESCSSTEKMVEILEVPLPHYPQYHDNYVVFNGRDGPGLLCSLSLNLAAANVVCKSTLGQYSNNVRSGSAPPSYHSGTRYSAIFNCSGDESTMEECNLIWLVILPSCPFNEVIVDCTPALPDLVPDLGTLHRSLTYYPYVDQLPIYLLQCAREENCLSSSAAPFPSHSSSYRSLLRFDSLTMNLGRADFTPIQGRDEWEYHTCHRHFHSFEAFIHYDLLNVTTREKVAEGHKASFCLEDSRCDSGGYVRYRCSTGVQGISVNCGDLYARHLDCQWIDITDVPLGRYILRLIVNPDRLAAESDHGNNEVSCHIELLPSFQLKNEGCSLSDH